MTHEEFMGLYMDFVRDTTESPFVYHRWCMLSTIATHMGADIHIPMGHFDVLGHFYIQLIGQSGSRKSSAIRIATKLVKEVGKVAIAPNQIHREALIALLDEIGDQQYADEDTFESIFAGNAPEIYTGLFIPADEFNNFVGGDKDSYMLLLSQLWDADLSFSKRLTKLATNIENPYINLLSGNTFPGFADVFDGKALGMGMLTRMIVVPWGKERVKIPFPPAPDTSIKDKLVNTLSSIHDMSGTVTYTPKAKELLGELYSKWHIRSPQSMEQYIQRRFIHLLKICAGFSAVEGTLQVNRAMVLNANTILASNEQQMSSTFAFIFAQQNVGAAMNKVYTYLQEHKEGANLGKLQSVTANVCSSQNLVLAINQLMHTNRIIYSKEAKIYLYKPILLSADMMQYINLDILTKDELSEFKYEKE